MAVGRHLPHVQKNIGPEYREVQPQLVQAFDNVRYWIEHETFSPDETAIRFHRDIVWIHPFPNDNGRVLWPTAPSSRSRNQNRFDERTVRTRPRNSRVSRTRSSPTSKGLAR